LRIVHSSFGALSVSAICPDLRTRRRGLTRCSFIAISGSVKFQIPDRYFQKINSDGKQPARWTAPKRDCFLKTLSSVLYMNRLLFMFKNILTSAGSTLREFSLSEIFRFVRGIHPEPEVPRVLYFRLNSAISHPPPAGGVELAADIKCNKAHFITF
jgi:hypothetical protein